MQTSYLVVIPARMASTRLPRKPLQLIEGKTLIQRTCEQVSKAIPKDKFLVATDDVEILNHVQELGYRAEMTSVNCMTGTDRVAEIAKKHDASFYINVQGDEPLINPDDISAVIEAAKEFPDDIINGYTKIDLEEDYKSLSTPKVVVRPDGRLLYMSRAAIPGNKHGGLDTSWRQVCVYSFPKEPLLKFADAEVKSPLEEIEDIEILRFLEMGYEVRMVELSNDSIAVDHPEDIKKVVKRLNGES